MSYVPKYLSESSSIKHVTVDLQLEEVATKKDLEGITHVETSSVALKTNLSTLKIEVDKLDIPKLGTLPTNVAKLNNKVANNLVDKTDFNSLKTEVDDNETDHDINYLKTKVDGIDLTKYFKKGDYDTKVGNLELKIRKVSGNLNTSDFNSKVRELENKIRSAESKLDITNLATKSNVTAVKNKIPDVKGFVKKKTDYATEITSIKNDYVTNAALTSQLNNLKSTHIADDVKNVDDKVKNNITDIVTAKNSLLHNKSVLDDLERKASFNRGFCYYNQQSQFLFEPKSKSFSRNGGDIHAWISTGIHNYSNNTNLFSVNNSNNNLPTLLNENNRLGITFNGNYTKQNKLGYAHGKIVNLYIVYELKNRRIDSLDFTVQKGLFGAVKITKNVILQIINMKDMEFILMVNLLLALVIE